MKRTYEEIGQNIGALVDEKNAAYGSSFAVCGEFLRLLYPKGLRPEQMTDALLLVRIFDKQMRIATDADALGESPYQDIAGYGLLGARMHEERKAGCGSVRQDAGEGSLEQNGSAEQSASAPITTSAAASSAPPSNAPSTMPSEHTSKNLDARTAEQSSSLVEEDLAGNKEVETLILRGLLLATVAPDFVTLFGFVREFFPKATKGQVESSLAFLLRHNYVGRKKKFAEFERYCLTPIGDDLLRVRKAEA